MAGGEDDTGTDGVNVTEEEGPSGNEEGWKCKPTSEASGMQCTTKVGLLCCVVLSKYSTMIISQCHRMDSCFFQRKSSNVEGNKARIL